jgi:protein BUR2
LYNSRTIAVAAFYNACKYCDVQLPDDIKGRPWWEVMHVRLPEVRRSVEYMAVHFEQISQNTSASAVAGSEGGRSIYVGLSTPNDQQDDLDVTRLREDRQDIPTGSPFPALQGQQRLAPGSERRLSNASSVGQKRDREEPAPATTNGAETNGTNSELPLHKRPKTDDEPDIPASASASQPGKQDPLHEEERLRVQNGDQKSATDVKPTPEAKEDPAEGSEEGEVEE